MIPHLLRNRSCTCDMLLKLMFLSHAYKLSVSLKIHRAVQTLSQNSKIRSLYIVNKRVINVTVQNMPASKTHKFSVLNIYHS